MDNQRIQDRVIDQLLELIKTNGYKPGDKLPAEISLARNYGVSRSSIREALGQLESRGIIEIRARSGSYVQSLHDDPIGTPLQHLLSFDQNKLWELLEVRKHVEAGAAELAAIRRNNAEIEEFREILGVLDKAHRENRLDEDVEKAYGRFFKNLSAASHNTLFTHFMDSIGDLSRSALPFSRVKLQQLPNTREVILEQLHQITDAIQSRDAGKARMSVIEHIEFVEKSLRDVLGYKDLNLLVREEY